MSQNGTYKIDVNNVRPGGSRLTSGIYIGDGNNGNRESFYAVRGTGSGNVVIYDKVLYLLSANTNSLGTEIEPDRHDYVASDYITVNKRKHGDDTIDIDFDTDLPITPTGYTIPANTDTANTKSGTWTITQFDDSPEFNDYVGDSVSITWTQKADYFVSWSDYIITGTPSSSDNIPYDGGDNIRTFTVNCKRTANYKSGAQYSGQSATFKVTGINNCTLKTPQGNVISEGTSGLADGLVISVSAGTRYHQWEPITVSFNITCDDNPGTTYNVSWVQNNDGYSYSRTVTETTITDSSINVYGGTTTLTFSLTNKIYYVWASDGAEFLQSTNNDGKATVSSDNPTACSISPTAVSHGDIITATVTDNKYNWYERSFTISANIGGGAGTITQNADGAQWSSSAGSISYDKLDTGSFPSTGGSKRFSVGLTRTHTYVWVSDGTFCYEATDNDGTASLSCTGGTLDTYTANHGDVVTVTVEGTSQQRTITFNISCYGISAADGWSQDGPSPVKPSPTINTSGASYESYGPPTPSNPILTVYYDGHIGGASELWFGLATANTSSAIVASGYTVGSDVEEICSYTLPSTSTTLYLFYKANVSTTINMGIADSGGSSMNYQAWLGTTGSQTRPISVTTSWNNNGAGVTGWQNNMHHVCTIFGVA